MARTVGACQGVWLARLLSEMQGEKQDSVVLKIDNKSAIALTKNPIHHERKYVDSAGHWKWARMEALLLATVLMSVANFPLPIAASEQDNLILKCTSSGQFTVKSAYHLTPDGPSRSRSNACKLVRNAMRNEFFDTNVPLQEWLRHNVQDGVNQIQELPWSLILGLGCWRLWMCRDSFIFNHRVSSLETTLMSEANLPKIQCNSKWTNPPVGVVKLNTDASISPNNHLAFGGGIIRDSNGSWLLGFYLGA
uniref:RNase H type-1 domain-containing protein n=1 Tax=Manihot esculenta TaxID=3983 RepID=A0A2C9VZW3_MANES